MSFIENAASAGGSGTVTNIATGTGLTGGPITTTGTISLVVPVSVTNGGTGANLSATGGANQFVKQSSSGAVFTVGTISSGDLPAGTGTVTSVALATGAGASDALYTISGSPVTTSGTITETLNTQTANKVFAGATSGGAASPTFRSLVTADLPAGTGTVTSVAMTGDGVIFNSTVTGSPVTTSGTLAPALLTQTKNTFLSGPTTGANAAPTFRVIGAGDIPSGTVTWDQIGNAAGALTLANAGNATTFNQTSGVTWKWANTTAATNTTPQNSPVLSLAGTSWTGAASQEDALTLQVQPASGANPTVGIQLSHTGSTGVKTIALGAAGNQAMSLQIFGTTSGSGILSAGTTGGGLNIANGAGGAASFTGASGLNLVGSGSATIALGTTVTIQPSGINNTRFTNGTGITLYNNIATTGSGVPAQYASVALTAQTAVIGTTTLYAVPAAGAGLYRILFYSKITTAASVSSVLGGTNGFQISFTDATDSTTPTLTSADLVTNALNANTTTTTAAGEVIVNAKASTNISYAYDYTSAGTAMAYKISIKLEYLGA